MHKTYAIEVLTKKGKPYDPRCILSLDLGRHGPLSDGILFDKLWVARADMAAEIEHRCYPADRLRIVTLEIGEPVSPEKEMER